jgi:hypothetical protein
MVEILDSVQIISSLQKPKKFFIRGSDKSDYGWLIKTKVKYQFYLYSNACQKLIYVNNIAKK